MEIRVGEEAWGVEWARVKEMGWATSLMLTPHPNPFLSQTSHSTPNYTPTLLQTLVPTHPQLYPLLPLLLPAPIPYDPTLLHTAYPMLLTLSWHPTFPSPHTCNSTPLSTCPSPTLLLPPTCIYPLTFPLTPNYLSYEPLTLNSILLPTPTPSYPAPTLSI